MCDQIKDGYDMVSVGDVFEEHLPWSSMVQCSTVQYSIVQGKAE